MTRVSGSAEQSKVARAVQCSVHERSTSMRFTQWQSWHAIFTYIVSPHVRRVERATPRVSVSSPHRGVSYRLLALLVVVACVSWTAPRHGAAAPPDDGAASGHEVIKWNQMLRLQILRIPGAQPPTISPGRSLAMLHIALFDAVNSIARSFTPYFIEVQASRGASK